MAEPEQRELASWKEIAGYLNRTARTCQRLEREMGLPIHRLDGSPKAHVFAYREELDAWVTEMIHERGKKRRRRLLILYTASVVVICGAAVILIKALGVGKPSLGLKAASGEKSIAVLLSTDSGIDQRFGYLADGIAEDVRNALMQIRGFRVPGRISSLALGNAKLGIREVGRALNVEYILEMNVQVAGDALRVTTSLISAGDGFHRWAGKYDLRMGDGNILVVEDQITRAIADQLKVKLLAREELALSKALRADLEAYDLYMKGRYLLGQPGDGPPDEALRFFERSLQREPRFALAYVGIGWAYMNRISLIQARGSEAGPEAESAIRKALEIDPDLPEAHALNGWVQFLNKYDWQAAGKSFERALELRPGDAMTRGWHAYYLFSMRRFEEARREIKLAIESDPLTPMLSAYSMWIHSYTGRYEEVLEEFRRVQSTGKSFEFAYFGAGLAYLGLGRIDESVAMFKRGCELPHSNGRPEGGLAVAYIKKGDRAAAEAIYRKLLEDRARNIGVYSVNLAWVAAEVGDIDSAIAWLETAVREHEPTVPVVQPFVETFLPGLAHDPRLLAILDRLGLPH